MSKKLIKCKSCGADIARSAKTCPHCGAKNKKKTALGIILVIVGVLLISAAFGGVEDKPQKVKNGSQSSGNSVTETTVTKNEEFTVGDAVVMNDITVTLVNVSENNGGNYMTPSEGKVFVVCEFEIENNSSKDIAVSSIMSFEAYIDDYTTNMNLSAMLSTNQAQLDGTIAVGKKMKGVIGYEADPDWSTLEIRFTPDFWAGKDIIFTATK